MRPTVKRTFKAVVAAALFVLGLAAAPNAATAQTADAPRLRIAINGFAGSVIWI